MVRERLERYCCNAEWLTLFPDAMVEHLVRYKSDHTPILKETKKKTKTSKQIEEIEKELKEDQKSEITEENIAKCAEIEKKLDELYEKQEAYWYIRSRSAEIKDEDKNTKYFHHKASQRRKRNEIKGLFDKNENWCTEDEELESIFQDFNENMFTSSGPADADCNKVLEVMQPVRPNTQYIIKYV
ncbi:hypothetical protein POM88_015275 [Heracleum sosnowskyi]|uniref:Uncharacterized protein n=1 Tax=Heracleum sosnowskyi TaxID=360622 RepID=A0AAD8IJV3_9APIA|nr:hypothetical protein POM88_015275 [Heracleum sosnowskyi]